MVSVWVQVALAAPVVHTPPVQSTVGADLRIEVQCSDLRDADDLLVMYRAERGGDWRSVAFERRPDDVWVALIPGKEMRGEWVEYYLVDDQGDAHFASAASPYRVPLQGQDRAGLQERELDRFEGQRTRFEAHGAWVPFGAPETMNDRHWRAGGSVTYRPLGPVRTLTFGYERMRGEALKPDPADDTSWLQDDPTDSKQWGSDYGYAAIELRASERFSVTPVLALGVDSLAFVGGAGARFRIGLDPGTHFRGWVFYLAGGTGWDTGVQLVWATVPRVPMAASVHVTNWPNGRVWGVRMEVQGWIPLGEYVDLELGVSYQARTVDFGGFGARGGLSFSF
jgi:hypothetical protein